MLQDSRFLRKADGYGVKRIVVVVPTLPGRYENFNFSGDAFQKVGDPSGCPLHMFRQVRVGNRKIVPGKVHMLALNPQAS